LDGDTGRNGICFPGKTDEETVAEQLHDAALVLLEGLGKCPREQCDEAAGGFIAQPLENAGAPDKVRKDDGCHDKSRLVVGQPRQFYAAPDWRLPGVTPKRLAFLLEKQPVR